MIRIPLVFSCLAVVFAALIISVGQVRAQSDLFIRGADVSHLDRLEVHTARFADGGIESDALSILQNHGVNWIRLRLWHTPDSRYSSLQRVIRMAKRAREMGLSFLLDIHYSDTWADPGGQTKPAAWADLEFDVLVDSVRTYTESVIRSLKAEGAMPQMVQIGNEIRSGMMWPDGRVGGSYDDQWPQFAELLKAGIEGVDAASTEEDSVEVIIHIHSGGDVSGSRWFYDNLAAHGVDFDVIGLSFYPWWHGGLSDLEANVNALATRFDKDIVIVETAYPWTLDWADQENNIVGLQSHLHTGYPASIEGQGRFLQAVSSIVENASNGRGRGIVYWEPTHIPAPGFGSPWENVALFDFEGNLLPSANALGGLAAPATDLDITFRYIPDASSNVVRAYVPGDFNGWDISVTSPAQMTFVDSLDQYTYTRSFTIGSTEYKINIHHNASGTQNTWLTDPLNPESNPADHNNSVLTVTDPMVFQPATELNANRLIDAVSAGVFSSRGIAELTFEVNGIPRDGFPHFDAQSGIFRYVLNQPITAGSQFKIVATDSAGTTVSAEIGEINQPVSWLTNDYETFIAEAAVRGSITRQDGTMDPDLTEATLILNGQESTVPVENGAVRADVALDLGANELLLRAHVNGSTSTSDTLLVTRRRHPLADSVVTAIVGGGGRNFSISLSPAPGYTSNDYGAASWSFDSTASTVALNGPIIFQLDGKAIEGTASGPGELYFDVAVESFDGVKDVFRVAVIVEADGTVRSMQYDETASWVNKAVVYEIFPLSFGPSEASGTAASPGRRFDEITAELDYIAQMGFTTLWFMPIFENQIMDQLSGGYNITDFYNVDPKLGTNEDFKELVDRAHELGLRVILDITPSHTSPVHPWVESLRALGEDSPFYEHIQTTPNPHNRGLDNRGANLAEIWHTEGGRNLYRKYDGFGDLTNVNWDDDDLQAAMLDIMAYWVREFDIDGWRFDVYWGPWRRYGPERFGRPVRQLMKRIKPDAWLLGEIAGTGPSTEVYYADDENGKSVVGGIDAGYDWNFYHNAIRGTYADLRTYDTYAHNNDFWPGPNARYFRFLENHDETRIAKVFASNPDRVLPLTGFLLTTTGIPMVYQGQEVNFGSTGSDFSGRRRPVSWQTARNGEFARLHQELSHVRISYPAFWTQDLTTLKRSDGVYAYVRPHLDENAVVAINFSGDTRTVALNPTPHVEMTTDGPITYSRLFSGTSITDDELDGFEFVLEPYETAVFITALDAALHIPNLPELPFGAVYTGSDRAAPELPARATLHPNYPNPFNPATLIPYSLPSGGQVRIEVYDVLGRRIAILVDAVRPAGRHELTFEAGNLPSGTYVVRLQAAGATDTRILTLTK